MAKLITRLGLLATLTCAVLSLLAVALGWLAPGHVIAFNTVDLTSDTPKRIFLIDLNTQLQRGIGAEAFRLNGDLLFAADNFHPVWSPDRRRIAYTHYSFDPQRDFHPRGPYIGVMNADGTNSRRLIEGNNPVWVSSDGRLLAYEANWVIYVIDVVTGERFNPTHFNRGEYSIDGQFGLSWSPQNNLIAMTWRRNGNDEIYVVEPDGDNLRNLTNHSAHDYGPLWSPDGQYIVFASTRDGNSQLYVMNAECGSLCGSQLRRVTHSASEIYYANWSPDSTRLVYYEGNAREGDIFVVNADGTNVRWLAQGTHPSWSPDGSQIAFISRRGDASQIYLINQDGSGLYRLTNGTFEADGYAPAWRP